MSDFFRKSRKHFLFQSQKNKTVPHPLPVTPPPPPFALAVNARTERVKASSQIIATMNMIKKALHIGTSETPRARRIFLNDSNLETQAYH